MKQTMMNTAAGVLAVLLLGGAGLAWADGFDPWLADGLNKQIQQNREAQQQPTYHGPTAAEIRAWEQREAEVQAEIAELRRTPFYMAITRDWDRKGLCWSGGYRSESRAIEESMKCHRGASNVSVITTFSNACAVLVYARNPPRSRNDIFVGIDKDDRRAAEKAMNACEAVHGKRKDRCLFSNIQTRNGTAFCAGYDYSVYGQD
ncbi:hypothetical protein A7Q01_05805 [Eikenella sp. NML96-A-049]|uniref:DUF4189 domain-containing protein n=1 Tax=unclassified Eikenella TaxID=2639367 RepID=UPI0007E180C8|nr:MULTISPECIES: DUF4189 domain-containing protein [unclassified Eikenella]OAM34228.1 hypothetical protein A7P97_03145 [Eikenella sp. NML070372]OAM38974.1 hypothetical protein A7Q01_05805 [Eikenella sp. NML96-A-049]